MDETNEQEVAQEIEETEAHAGETIEESDDPSVLKARIKKLEEKAIAQRERGKMLKQEIAKKEKQSGELDTASYAYLAAKGYENDEDIEYIHNRMTKWDVPP